MTRKIASVCVYCGSGPGDDPAYTAAAHNLGEIFAENKITGVFGGGSIGLMGAFSSSMIGHGGNVIGVIPELLVQREQPIQPDTNGKGGVFKLIRTEDMYARKAAFRKLSDGFVLLPGGCGSMDEFFEELTGLQIGDHAKPMVVVNVNGYWDPLLALLEHMRKHHFVRPGLDFDTLFTVVARAEDVLPELRRLAGETNVIPFDQRHAAG